MIKKQRSSNIELLRIVLMCMIILQHIIVHGFNLKGIGESGYVLNESIYLELFANSFVAIAVNAFVFISGYYGIKFKIRNIILFALQGLFYSVFIYLAFSYFNPELFSIKDLAKTFFPLSRDVWWFLTAYIALCFVAPFLNAGMDQLNKQQLIVILAGLLYFDCFSGFMVGVLSDNGYNIFHLIVLYIAARFMGKYAIQIKYPSVCLVASTVLIFGAALLLLRINSLATIWKLYNYNNPLLIASAVSLFYVFKDLKIQSSIINSVSTSVFGVYLVHDHELVRERICQVVQWLNINSDGVLLVGEIFVLVGIVFVLSIAIEKARYFAFTYLEEICIQYLNRTKFYSVGKKMVTNWIG